MHETLSTTRAHTPPRRMIQETKDARQPHPPPPTQRKDLKLIKAPDRSRQQQRVLNDPTQDVMSMEYRMTDNRLPTLDLQSKSTSDSLPTLQFGSSNNLFTSLINKVYFRFLYH